MLWWRLWACFSCWKARSGTRGGVSGEAASRARSSRPTPSARVASATPLTAGGSGAECELPLDYGLRGISPWWRVGARSGAAASPERILRGNSGCVPSTHPHCQLFQHGGYVTEQFGQRVAARGDMSIWWGLGRYAPEGTPDDPDRPGASEHRPAPQTWALYPPGVGW